MATRKANQAAPKPTSPTGLAGEPSRADDRGQSGQFLTTAQGLRLPDTDHSLKAGERGPTLLEDFHLREKITHFDHERIPERVVHARGAAAHGIFESYGTAATVTKAGFLAKGVTTPVFTRFSTVRSWPASGAKKFAASLLSHEARFIAEISTTAQESDSPDDAAPDYHPTAMGAGSLAPDDAGSDDVDDAGSNEPTGGVQVLERPTPAPPPEPPASTAEQRVLGKIDWSYPGEDAELAEIAVRERRALKHQQTIVETWVCILAISTMVGIGFLCWHFWKMPLTNAGNRLILLAVILDILLFVPILMILDLVENNYTAKLGRFVVPAEPHTDS